MFDQALIWLCGGTLLLVGLVGCLVPVIPGPVLGYAALGVLWLFGVPPPSSQLWLGAGIVVVVTVLDSVLPTYFAKKFKCSKSGILGCFVGTIVGLFFLPWGLILGPVLGTVAGELSVGKSLYEASKGGVGAFCGFVTSLLAKLAAVGLFGWWFVSDLMAKTGGVQP